MNAYKGYRTGHLCDFLQISIPIDLYRYRGIDPYRYIGLYPISEEILNADRFAHEAAETLPRCQCAILLRRSDFGATRRNL